VLQTTDRQTTDDGRAIAYSEGAREFTFAKTRNTGTVHTSAKARLTSVAIRILIRVRICIRIRIRDPDSH